MANTVSFLDPRHDDVTWWIRILQLIFVLAILGVTGQGASIWGSIDCNTPSKLALAIAVAAITLPIVLYHLVTTRKKPLLAALPWHPYATIGVDAFLLILTIVAVASSQYDCSGVCSACTPLGEDVFNGADFYVYYGSLLCMCTFDLAEEKEKRDVVNALLGKRAISPSAAGGLNKYTEKSFGIAAKQGLGAVMIFLLVGTIVRVAMNLYRQRKAQRNGTDVEGAEHGVPELSGLAGVAGAVDKMDGVTANVTESR